MFLTHPELFPGRISGETWGAEALTIELAGESYRIEGLSPTQAESLRDRFGSRVVPRGSSGSSRNQVVTLQLFRAPASDFHEIDTRGWEYWLDVEWRGESVRIAGMRLMALLDLAAARGGIWTCVESREETWGVIENVLRPLVAARLLAQGGLLVHSAAVDGFLFAGASGAGKSTIARMGLDAGLPVSSDDINALVRTGDRFILAPLPFTGDLEEHEITAEAIPLRALVALEKGTDESLRALALAEAVSLLVRSAPYVNLDPERAALLLDRAAEIATAVPRQVLTFRREGNPWPILHITR
ncbi:MAG TPA: hypothetical protein VGF48_01015 [Thermoanaerobaculia bacterium]|jgi:hypothetical protein